MTPLFTTGLQEAAVSGPRWSAAVTTALGRRPGHLTTEHQLFMILQTILQWSNISFIFVYALTRTLNHDWKQKYSMIVQ